jgi:hypothetical protein
MKNLRFIAVVFSLMMLFSSCKVFSKVFGGIGLFKPKYGCPSNGKNVGAERILSGDPKAVKDAKKAKKFRS